MKGNKLIDDHIQISVNLLRFKSHGKIFEIAVDPDKAVAYREGDQVDLEEIITSDSIFEDMKKGLVAKKEDLLEVFESTDTNKIVALMLEKGELQFTQKYRSALREKKFNKIVNLIHVNAIDPKTGFPHPEKRIISAMEEAKIKINDFKKPQDQIKEIVDKLRPIIPISIETIKLNVHVPAEHSSRLYGKISGFGKLSKEQWLSDGSLSVDLDLPAGLREQVVSELANDSHGSVIIEVKKEK
ncbi:MAG: ribosome assembly factor SBDS [Nanoarchaeota archaeon]|nr:ribosome assembly factor SBDS [Nanoarchaeota archaeon]